MSSIVSRRNFVKAGALTVATLAAGGLFAACSQDEQTPAQTSAGEEASQESASAQTATQQDAATPPMPVEGKVLVAYYSAQGHTRAIAERIAERTGGDLFEIAPSEPYSNDDLNWRNENSRVTREHEDTSLRNIPLAQTAPDNFADYETVFVGYPIWWQGAAWPVNRFLQDNNFVRKTVVPFCTSQSSPIGNTRNDLEALAGSGEWLDGQRFGENPQEGVVENWIDSLSI